jgi:hypothetical protein
VRELRFQLDEAETLVKSLSSDSASERLKSKQMINDMEAELEQCLRDRETDKQVSARALENSDRSRAVEIEDWLEREQALTDENIILKNANEDLRVELNGTIRQREYEKESLSQGQARELALAEENSKLKLENSELQRDKQEPIFSPASAMQTAAKLNSRAESNSGTHIPSPASAMQTARQEDTRQRKSTDSKRRAEILSPASITSAATVGFKATPLATTTLPESKHMGLDTVAISVATDEESTPVRLVIAVKDGADSDQVFLTTSSTAAAESRQVGLDTAVKAADEAGKGCGRDSTGCGVDTD